MIVELIDIMGDDLRVANAARVSFHKESEWEEGQWTNIREDFEDEGVMYKEVGKEYRELKLSEADQKLILYLAKHNHWTPFSHVQITLREKVPIFVARQRFKHMVGFTYNEISRRYVDDTPEFYIPDTWRGKPVNAKQGSSDEVITHVINPYNSKEWEIKEAYSHVMKEIALFYEKLLEADVAPEQARMVLPQSMYTEYYVTGSLAAWARAYRLRSDIHSQKEIQDLARMWNEIIGGIVELKHSWKALTQ